MDLIFVEIFLQISSALGQNAVGVESTSVNFHPVRLRGRTRRAPAGDGVSPEDPDVVVTSVGATRNVS